MKKASRGLPLRQIVASLPFHLAFDRNLCLVECGEAIRRLGIATIGVRLDDVFRIVRPAGISTAAEMLKRPDQTFLLEARSSGLRLLGTIHSGSAKSDRLFFLGTPVEGESGFSLANPATTIATHHLRTTSIGRRRRLRLLSLPGRVADALARADPSDRNAQAMLSLIGTALQLDLGLLWLIDDQTRRIECRNVWRRGGGGCSRFEEALRATSFTPDPGERGLPGRCWTTGEPLVTTNPAEEHAIAKDDPGRDESPAEGFAFPILVGSETIGVFEFFCNEPLKMERSLLSTLQTVGRQIGDFIERQHAVKELRAAREATEEAALERGRFLANVSHEIRTPMNAIVGLASLLLDRSSSPEERDYLGMIRSSADELLRIVNELLDFSKIESGNLQIVTAPFKLRDCVEEAADLFVIEAGRKSLGLYWLIDERLPEILIGDALRLRQVLINLIGNAIKFSEAGEVTIRVEGSRRRDGDWRLSFSVEDTGIGIPASQLDRLFQPFSQVDASASRRHGGTGLGLVICQRLVELMSGTIEVASEPGRGSTFSFNIPAAEVAYSEPRETSFDNRRILLVLPPGKGRIMLRQQIQSLGMTTSLTTSPESARHRIGASEHFDAILAARQLISADSRLLSLAASHQIPVIIIGHNGQHRTLTTETVLPQPVRRSTLGESLSRIFDGERQPRRTPSAHPPQTLPILIVEDNPVNQKVMTLTLQRLGFQPDVAASGAEALQALDHHDYDVVFMDIQMPEMDGIETTKHIRRQLPASRQPRIIAITASALPEQRAACLAAGMDGYLSKPLRPEDLSATLAAIDPHHADDSIRTDLPAEIVNLFFSDADARIDRMHQALSAGNAESLRREAHALTGSAHTIGARTAGAISQKIEELARSAALSEAEPLISQLEQKVRQYSVDTKPNLSL